MLKVSDVELAHYSPVRAHLSIKGVMEPFQSVA